MLEILSRRWPSAEIWVCPVRVQGDGASEEIAAALGRLNEIGAPELPPERRIDVIIVGRGGGSLEDLWAFNEEVVARAIFRSRIPVVSGVGHEDDLTIADLVADVRALTPSEAAERVVPDSAELLAWLGDAEVRMRSILSRAVKVGRERVLQLAARRCLRAPLDRIKEQRTALADWDQRLTRAARQGLTQGHERLGALAGCLEALSPLNVLGRGYSLTRKEDGAVVRDAGQVRPGERVVIDVQRGRLVSRVEECQLPSEGLRTSERESVS
jgi:exodeoxyribonuclease VII large subunit